MAKVYCDAHEDFIVAVTKLSTEVSAMRALFKWSLSAMLMVTIALMGVTVTFVYKASDLYAQVQVNTTKIDTLAVKSI